MSLLLRYGFHAEDDLRMGIHKLCIAVENDEQVC